MTLIIGTIFSYFCLLFVPLLRFYPIPFIIFFFFTYKHLRDYKKSLFLLAVFSLPYGIGKTVLNLNDSSSITITPYILTVILLSFLNLKKSFKQSSVWSSVFLLLFLFWGMLSYIFFAIYPEVLGGVFMLITIVLFYFLARIYMQEKDLYIYVTFILTTTLLFESCLTIFQFIIGHPLGLYIEEGVTLLPYGKLASEITSLYRPSGTFIEPTWMARFLTILLPIILIELKSITRIDIKYRSGFIILSLLAIFATFTRVSWAVTLIMLLIVYMWRKPKIDLSVLKKPVIIFCSIIIFFLYIYRLFPLLENRIATSSRSFEEMGSFDTRMKLIEQAASLISQYPLFGVGINRFITMAQADDVTGFFRYQMVQVHNVFLIIASEMGIPAMIFFILFIISAYYKYLDNKNKIKDFEIRKFTNIAAISGLAYLLESQMGTIFLSPHLSLFMLYMAIISG